MNMNPVVLFLLFFILFAVALLGVFYNYRNLHKASKGVINYDNFMRNFVFKIEKTKDEILAILSNERKSDFFSCTLIEDEKAIIFYEFGDKGEYRYDIQEFDGYCILRLKQISFFTCTRQILYQLNLFIVKKLDAEIIPYSEEGFDF